LPRVFAKAETYGEKAGDLRLGSQKTYQREMCLRAARDGIGQRLLFPTRKAANRAIAFR
jgi:hypothetical protein